MDGYEKPPRASQRRHGGEVESRSSSRNRPPRKSRLVGHVFIEADGSVSVTPCVRSTIDDIRRVKARLCCSRWRDVNERLLAGRERGR